MKVTAFVLLVSAAIIGLETLLFSAIGVALLLTEPGAGVPRLPFIAAGVWTLAVAITGATAFNAVMSVDGDKPWNLLQLSAFLLVLIGNVLLIAVPIRFLLRSDATVIGSVFWASPFAWVIGSAFLIALRMFRARRLGFTIASSRGTLGGH